MKQAYFLLGLNGAGKSSLRDLENFDKITIIDADKIQRETNCSEIEAGKKAIHLFRECIKNNKSFLLESTLTGNLILKQIETAKQYNYNVNCVYVGLNSLSDHIDRVAIRVQNGGHNIPIETIERRYLISYGNIKKLFNLSSSLAIYDNTQNYAKQFELTNNEMKRIQTPQKWIVDHVILPYTHSSFKEYRNRIEEKQSNGPISKIVQSKLSK
ncbi:hypothetical protein RHO12_07795 [Orbus sturtevantii]|uniref:hypothetical protein n=1 Tax=Orbus sturtevantii TaxID=3074109 RepID=UPI00370D9F9B